MSFVWEMITSGSVTSSLPLKRMEAKKKGGREKKGVQVTSNSM